MIKHVEIVPAVIGFTVAAIVWFTMVLWMFPIPLEYFDRQASKQYVKEGDLVTITWVEKRTAFCDSVVHRKLISADNIIVEFEPVADPPKAINELVKGSYTFKVPPGLRSGVLIYRARSEFHCNFVQRLLGGHILVMPDIVLVYLPKP